MSRAQRILIVEPDASERAAVRAALSQITQRVPLRVVGEVSDGVAAIEFMAHESVDLLVSELELPRMEGVELMRHLAGREARPAVVLISHYDLERERRFAALGLPLIRKPITPQALACGVNEARKVSAEEGEQLRALQPGPRRYLSCVERGKIRLVAVDEISYLRAELKYVTAKTPGRDYLLDASLTQLEQEFGERFLRVHRNCLVARQWIAGFERTHDAGGEPHWLVRLSGSSEKLPVSRRQWPVVRART
ncbi:MAG: hypothetical protein RIR70_270 [Pseudomonadota bacterium]|jgi:two-component system response regulator AlgR